MLASSIGWDIDYIRNPGCSRRACSAPFENGSRAVIRLNGYQPCHDILCTPLGSPAVRCLLIGQYV